MSKFHFHFSIGLHALATLFLLVVLFALPFVALAQDGETPPALPEWVSFLPTALSALVGVNFKLTDIFRRLLAANEFGGARFTPPKNVQNVIVIVFSLLLGVGLVLVTPNAAALVPDWLTTWLPLKVLYAGISISVLGGFVYDISKKLNDGSSVYKSTTELSAPSSDTPPDTAKAVMQTASDVASSGKG
jgi:hypothetical protein